MTTINYFGIKEELTVFLRNQNIFTISQRGVITTTEEFNGDAAETEFTVSQSNIKNVRSVTIGGVAQTFGDDYTVNYETAVITFTSAPGSGTNNVDIQYDYGTDKIFPDFPKNTLNISNFPRIAVDLISVTTDPAGFGNVLGNRITFTVVVYDKSSKAVSDYLTAIRAAFIANYTSFYYLKGVIVPISTGPYIKFAEQTKDKIFQQNIDFESRFNYEKN